MPISMRSLNPGIEMSDIVISEFMDAAAIDDVLASFDVRYDPSLVDDRRKLLEACANARALIVRNRTRVDTELLDNAPELLVVGRLGVGLDNIDTDQCESRDITVYPATGANDLAVAEYVIAAALMLLRGVWQANAQVIAGDWPRSECIGREAAGRRLGLIGLGAIARQVAHRATALGMKILAYDPYLSADHPAWVGIDSVPLNDIAGDCDVVSVHVPLTDSTRHLIGADFIAKMRAGAVLINTARGGVVDEKTLVSALQQGRIGGASLDVFETEPVNANTGKFFAAVPNLLLTPHIAGITEESNVRVSRLTAQQVATHLQA